MIDDIAPVAWAAVHAAAGTPARGPLDWQHDTAPVKSAVCGDVEAVLLGQELCFVPPEHHRVFIAVVVAMAAQDPLPGRRP